MSAEHGPSLPDGKTRRVTVCAACLTASCWHGVFFCQCAKSADVTTRTVAELDSLGLEHPSNYSVESVRAVEGTL